MIGRHSSERLTKLEFTKSIITGVAAGSASQEATEAAAVIANLVNMIYGQ